MTQDAPGAHSIKRVKRGLSEVDAGNFEIRFSPEVLDVLNGLVRIVRLNKDFDEDLFCVLTSMASGTPQSIGGALESISSVSAEVARYAVKTGDKKALEVLMELQVAFSPDAFTLIQAPKQRGL